MKMIENLEKIFNCFKFLRAHEKFRDHYYGEGLRSYSPVVLSLQGMQPSRIPSPSILVHPAPALPVVQMINGDYPNTNWNNSSGTMTLQRHHHQQQQSPGLFVQEVPQGFGGVVQHQQGVPVLGKGVMLPDPQPPQKRSPPPPVKRKPVTKIVTEDPLTDETGSILGGKVIMRINGEWS